MTVINMIHLLYIIHIHSVRWLLWLGVECSAHDLTGIIVAHGSFW